MNKQTHGSVLVLVLIVAASTGMVLTSLSQLAISEKRFNDNARLMLEAKEAAEATVECGFAQLVRRFEKRTAFPINALSPKSGNPIVLTDDFYALFQTGSGLMQTRVKMPAYPYDPAANWGSQETELIGGAVAAGAWLDIDPRDPANAKDPLIGKRVFVRSVEVLGKASVENITKNYRYTSYVSQFLEVRDAPLFAHAIFYNLDMEIAPGPNMDITGSVHSNGRMYIQANSSLDFQKRVTAVGQIYHGPNPSISKGTAYGKVTFSNGLGNQVPMYDGSSWLDSDTNNFASVSSNRWNDEVMAYEHGIQRQNPVSIEDYEPDDPGTSANELRNYAYQIIQPLKNASSLSADDVELEKQKFAYKAGLVIHVEVPKVNNLVHDYETDLDDGKDPYDEDVQERFFNIHSSSDPTAQAITVYRYDRSGNLDEVAFNSDGSPKIETFTKLDVQDSFLRVKPYSASKKTVESGLYDQRMREGISLIEIDVSKLKDAVEASETKAKKYWDDSGNNTAAIPESWWNGVVYIQVSTKADPNRPDGVIPAEDGWGVKLVKGDEIPNPSFALSNDIFGMTVATNAPIYIQGNYNADGKSSTGSSTNPDSSNEPVAAIIADAVTILSNSWDDEDSLQSTSTRTTNSFTEVAAAILTGLVPSNKNNWNNYSGGVENFPRFLEKWRTTLRYRGSMVALFESEVANEPWGKSNVYGAPSRDWGFNSLYALGKFPPGTPNTRTFERVNYHNLKKADYTARIEKLKQQIN